MTTFNYSLGDYLVIKCSQECGEVIGRAEYSLSENQYLLRYQEYNGGAVERWWVEEALTRFLDTEYP